ncbi:unnamed protein product [Amoebophrya sp. A25]|nr:unnamed protein product [Amoebophrya sp. A25]|eukprot:GSA25T00014602001.1
MVVGHMKKTRLRYGLSVTTHDNPQWRPSKNNLLADEQQVPIVVKGVPQFLSEWDRHTAHAKLRRRFIPTENLPKRRPNAEWNYDNCHEMQGKFRFVMEGRFQHGVEALEKAIFDAASALSLVGWFKARRKFAQGHLQGDVFALSEMKKWILQEHVCSDVPALAGCVFGTNISDENWAIAEPLDYKQLISVKDMRTLLKKLQHRDSVQESSNLQQLEARSRSVWQERADRQFNLHRNGWVSIGEDA